MPTMALRVVWCSVAAWRACTTVARPTIATAPMTAVGGSKYWIGDYTIEPENGGVGVFAHEFGHDLGLPDLYNTGLDSHNIELFAEFPAGKRLVGRGESGFEGVSEHGRLLGIVEEMTITLREGRGTQSWRRATTASIRVALRAGTKQAANATRPRISATPAKVSGSAGGTP